MKLIFPSRKEVHFAKPQAATNITNAIRMVFVIFVAQKVLRVTLSICIFRFIREIRC